MSEYGLTMMNADLDWLKGAFGHLREEPLPDEDIEEYEPQVPGAPQKARTPASPRAKRLAREKGVDLSLIKGTGEDGRIVEEDVVAYLEASGEPAGVPGTEAPPAETSYGVIETVRHRVASRRSRKGFLFSEDRLYRAQFGADGFSLTLRRKLPASERSKDCGAS